MKEQTETPEDIKSQRDALVTVVSASQEAQRTAEGVIELLIVAGFINREHVQKAKSLLAK